MLPAISHMDMAVQEIFWIVFFYQGVKNLKAAMWQIVPIVEPEGRSVGDQNVKAFTAEELPAKLSYSLAHFAFGVLALVGVVFHGTAKPENAHALVHINLVIDADASFRRSLFVFSIMIAMHINDRGTCKCCKKRKIFWV